MANVTHQDNNAGELQVVKVHDGRTWRYCIAADDARQPALQQAKQALSQALGPDEGMVDREELDFMRNEGDDDECVIEALVRNLRNHFKTKHIFPVRDRARKNIGIFMGLGLGWTRRRARGHLL